MMKFYLTFVITTSAYFCLFFGTTFATTITVDAKSNIYGAGHSAIPDYGKSHTGNLPPAYSFSAAPNQVLSFSSVTGSITYNGGGNWYGPEEWYGIGNITDIVSVGGISGTYHGERRNYLIGVFLDNSEPTTPAPSTLNFGISGIQDDFTELFPELNQTFFIGDGLTGTNTGTIQYFYIPDTATRLFLGFADGYNFVGLPYLYSDNSGSLTANFEITTISNPVPEPASILIFGTGLVGLVGTRLRRKKNSLSN